MTAAEYKERAIRFLENFNHPDPRIFEELITDDFRFEMITTMKEFAPVRGKTAFARSETERLNALFPDGLKMKLGIIVCDGPHVAAQARMRYGGDERAALRSALPLLSALRG